MIWELHWSFKTEFKIFFDLASAEDFQAGDGKGFHFLFVCFFLQGKLIGKGKENWQKELFIENNVVPFLWYNDIYRAYFGTITKFKKISYAGQYKVIFYI